MKQVNQFDAIHYIATGQEFTASALSGKREAYTPDSGRLNSGEFSRLVVDFNKSGGSMYVVYSYGTPIAWHTLEGWYIVEQKFSVTTSKHSNYVRRGIAESLQGVN